MPLSTADEFEPVEPFPAACSSDDDEPEFVVDDAVPLSTADDEFEPVELPFPAACSSDDDEPEFVVDDVVPLSAADDVAGLSDVISLSAPPTVVFPVSFK